MPLPDLDHAKLFDKAPTFMCALRGPEHVFEMANEAYLRLVGGRNILGRPVREALPDIADQGFYELLDRVYATGERHVAWGSPIRLRSTPSAPEEEQVLDFIYEPIHGTDGDVAGIFVQGHDITERARAEAALRASEARLARVLEQVPVAVGLFDADGRLTLKNSRAGEILGEVIPSRDAAEGHRWQGFDTTGQPVPPEAYPGARALRGEDATTPVDFRRVEDGTGRWLRVSAVPVRGEAGQVSGGVVVVQDVTEELRVQQALRASEERYRRIVEGADDFAIITIDEGGVITSWSAGAERLMGYTEAEAVGQPAAMFFTCEDRASGVPDRELNKAASANRAVNERWHLRKDGSRFWGSGLMMQVDGPGSGFVKIFRDRMTEHEAEARLRASEAQVTGVLDGMSEGFVLLDRDFRILRINAAGLRIDGRPASEILGRSHWEVWPGSENAPQGRLYKRLMAERTSGSVEARYAWPVGEKWFEIRADPVEEGLAVFYRDITERRRTEARRAALTRIANRLCDLEDPAEIAFAAAEELGGVLGAGRVGYGTVDHEAETLHVERDWTAPGVVTLAGTTRLRQFGSFVDDMKRGETTIIRDVRTDPRVAGTALAALDRLSGRSFVNVPVVEQGRLVALLFVNDARVRDWSPEDLDLIREVAGRTRMAVERARAAAALREANERLEQRVAERTAERDRMWETSPDLMVVIDFEGVFRRVNPAWAAVLGYALDELVGHHVNEFVVPDDHGATAAAYELAAQGGQPRIVNRYRAKDGSLRWISWTAAPAGDVTYATGRDITAQVETEEQLRQVQKMDAMGQLTGGVAHDFNNLLTPIVAVLDRLERQGLGGEREQRLIAGAAQSAERARTLVQRLLAFARRQPLQPRPVDVGELVRGMADLVRSTTGPQIRVAVEVAPDLPPALADANQLEMATLNLAVNARDAMPEGGTLRLTVTSEAVRGRHPSGVKPGRYVRLSVADTGVGMDEPTLARAVEPFFSTKAVGQGTGLGLSMVHGLAAQLGGALRIQSRPGLGTHVELWLPVTQGSAEAQAGADNSTKDNARAGGTVLLVDDEPLVRASTAAMLAELGYHVREAGSGQEALERVEREGLPDLVVTDHLMPDLHGTELARQLRERRPGLPVLIISGYAGVEGIAPDLPRLVKPFRRAELEAAMAELVGERKPAS